MSWSREAAYRRAALRRLRRYLPADQVRHRDVHRVACEGDGARRLRAARRGRAPGRPAPGRRGPAGWGRRAEVVSCVDLPGVVQHPPEVVAELVPGSIASQEAVTATLDEL